VRAFPGHIILAQAALSRLGIEETVADFIILRADFTAVAAVQLALRGARLDPHRDTERRLDVALPGAGIRLLQVYAEDIPTDAALRALVAALPLQSSKASSTASAVTALTPPASAAPLSMHLPQIKRAS
jgi:hypothetical protein